MDNKLTPASFEETDIRRVWDEESEQWYFAVVDVIEALTESTRPRKYWNDLKRRVKKQSDIELSAFCGQFPMKHKTNNRTYQTECANVESMFRIIQSIPSPKAEPFKQWLAKVGYQRIQEINEPALAAQRARELYKAKGYSDEWIDSRLQSIDIRNDLTNEWAQREVKEGLEYAILTAEISKGTFGIKPGEHKQLKGLKRQNLRDHMTKAELVFTMLGELSTTEIAIKEDAQGFDENKVSARKGGKIAGDARRALESQTGKPVVSEMNYLATPEAEQQELPPEHDADAT